MRAVDLDVAGRALLAPVCRRCTWWQGRPRESWERDVEAEAGLFGRLLLEGDDVLGWMHVAPAQLVPRARGLPGGPPSPDAWLLICAYFYDGRFLQAFQYLLLDLVAALKQRRTEALEAYAVRERCPDDRFRGYLPDINLFNAQVLEGNGFRRVRGLAGPSRYRLELATLVEAPRRGRADEALARGAATQPV